MNSSSAPSREPQASMRNSYNIEELMNGLTQHPQFKYFVRQQANLQIKQALKEGRLGPSRVPNQFIPRMDLLDDESTPLIVATYELPGVRVEDVKLQITNGALVVSGMRRPRPTTLPPGVKATLALQSQAGPGSPSRPPVPSVSPHRVSIAYELRYGRFYRAKTLPPGIRSEHITAQFQEGLLTVTWPRTVPPITSPSPTSDSQLNHCTSLSGNNVTVHEDKNVGPLATVIPVSTAVKEEPMEL